MFYIAAVDDHAIGAVFTLSLRENPRCYSYLKKPHARPGEASKLLLSQRFAMPEVKLLHPQSLEIS